MRFHDPVPEFKRILAEAVVRFISGWSQCNAAYFLDCDQPRVSNLRRGKLDPFSLEQLIRFATRMGATVRIEILPPPREAFPGSRLLRERNAPARAALAAARRAIAENPGPPPG